MSITTDYISNYSTQTTNQVSTITDTEEVGPSVDDLLSGSSSAEDTTEDTTEDTFTPSTDVTTAGTYNPSDFSNIDFQSFDFNQLSIARANSVSSMISAMASSQPNSTGEDFSAIFGANSEMSKLTASKSMLVQYYADMK